MVALNTLDRAATAEREALAIRAGDELEGASALEILGWADEHFGPRNAHRPRTDFRLIPLSSWRFAPGQRRYFRCVYPGD